MSELALYLGHSKHSEVMAMTTVTVTEALNGG